MSTSGAVRRRLLLVRFWARLRRVQGQVTVEWLMVAGLLTAMAIVIMGTVPTVLIRIVHRIAMSLRTIAP
jgi:hypothetical protein